MSDEGVSELLGYALLAGVVIAAVVCIASGVGGAITSAAESAGFSETGLAVRSFAATASEVARVNNTCYTASEVRAPAGYELIVLDRLDDVARFAVYSGNREIFAAGVGSIRLRSPFRSIVCESGAVFGNDSGLVNVILKPSVFTADGSLYIFLTAISADSVTVAGGRPVILDVRAVSMESVDQSVEDIVIVSMTSTCPEGWSAVFRRAGFSVAQEGNKITATTGGITDVYIECATLHVQIER